MQCRKDRLVAKTEEERGAKLQQMRVRLGFETPEERGQEGHPECTHLDEWSKSANGMQRTLLYRSIHSSPFERKGCRPAPIFLRLTPSHLKGMVGINRFD